MREGAEGEEGREEGEEEGEEGGQERGKQGVSSGMWCFCWTHDAEPELVGLEAPSLGHYSKANTAVTATIHHAAKTKVTCS